MPTAKYNKEKIKQAYFESDKIEVQAFLMTSLGLAHKTASNSYWKANSKGWRGEKEAIRKAQTEKAKQELENDPKVKLANQNILSAILAYETTVAKLIGQGNLDLNDAVKAKPLWEVLRISQNLPTSYDKTLLDTNSDNRESITINLI